MKRLLVSHLVEQVRLTHDLLHENGAVLFARHEELRADHIRLLLQCGIDQLWRLESGDRRSDFIAAAQCEKLLIEETRATQRLGRPVYDPQGMLLINRDVYLNTPIKKELAAHGIREVWVQKEGLEFRATERFLEMKPLVRARAARQQELKRRLGDVKMLLDAASLDEGAVEERLAVEPATVEPTGEPVNAYLNPDDALWDASRAERERFQAMRRQMRSLTGEVFETLGRGGTVDSRRIARLSEEVIGQLVENHRLLLSMVALRKTSEYLYEHSVNVAVLATNIATAMGYSAEQAFEVGYGAFLGDIGMTRLPTEVLEKPSALDDREIALVQRHPLLALELLRGIESGIPKSTPLMIYQSHEKPDGSGYPRRKNVRAIHSYAQIIHVADMYDAMISERPHREAFAPYDALVRMLLQVKQGALPSNVVRGLLDSLGLFPLGTFVLLNSGEIARVLSVKPGRHTQPKLRLCYHKDRPDEPLQDRVLDLTEQPRITVLRALPFDQVCASALTPIEG